MASRLFSGWTKVSTQQDKKGYLVKDTILSQVLVFQQGFCIIPNRLRFASMSYGDFSARVYQACHEPRSVNTHK